MNCKDCDLPTCPLSNIEMTREIWRALNDPAAAWEDTKKEMRSVLFCEGLKALDPETKRGLAAMIVTSLACGVEAAEARNHMEFMEALVRLHVTVVSAYLLGVRDAAGVPDVFKDAFRDLQ